MASTAFSILALVALGGTAGAAVDFVQDIQPIFSKHCYKCHGSHKQEAAFRVLVDDVRVSRARLFLVGVLADVLREGLGLCGIDALEEM